MAILQTSNIDADMMATSITESGKRREVNDADVTWFSNQLAGTDTASLPNTVRLEAQKDNVSLGDTVLNGLQRVGTGLHEEWERIIDGLAAIGPEPSSSEMLRLQMDLLALEFNTEIVSTVIKKLSGAVDQLVHTQ